MERRWVAALLSSAYFLLNASAKKKAQTRLQAISKSAKRGRTRWSKFHSAGKRFIFLFVFSNSHDVIEVDGSF
jgi:hypothetical protein